MSDSKGAAIDEILLTLADELINYEAKMTEAKAPPIRFVHKYNSKAKQAILAILAWRDKAVKEAQIRWALNQANKMQRKTAGLDGAKDE